MGEVIKWTSAPQCKHFDWCGQHRGKYVDLVRGFHEGWFAYYNSKVIAEGLETRDDALQALLKYVSEEESG